MRYKPCGRFRIVRQADKKSISKSDKAIHAAGWCQ